MKNFGEGHLHAARALHERYKIFLNSKVQVQYYCTHSFDRPIEFHLSSKLRFRGIIILYRRRESRQSKVVQ